MNLSEIVAIALLLLLVFAVVKTCRFTPHVFNPAFRGNWLTGGSTCAGLPRRKNKGRSSATSRSSPAPLAIHLNIRTQSEIMTSCVTQCTR